MKKAIWDISLNKLTVNYVVNRLRGKTDYFQRTRERNHAWFIKGLTFFVSNPLKAGNEKLDKGVLISSTAPIVCCPLCKDCKGTCYACNSLRQYDDVCNSRMIWSLMVKYDMDYYFQLISNQLKRTSKRIVRIHESGDFISQEYVNAWYKIVKAFPNIKFYTYTKTNDIFDFSEIEKLPNFKLNKSYIHGFMNYGTLGYLENLKKLYPGEVAVCPATLGKNVHCGKNCKLCIENNGKCVAFVGHGSDFETSIKNAKKTEKRNIK